AFATATEDACAAADAAAYAAVATYTDAVATDAVFDITKINGYRIEDILINDLHLIRTGRFNEISYDFSIFKNILADFLTALRDIDCSYWANWYEALYNNNFAFEAEEVIKRFNAPDEYIKQGAAAVGRYMERLTQGAEHMNETRIIILGEKGAGKTCLARRLVNPNADMTSVHDSTEGVETSLWSIRTDDDERNVKARIWDFAGHVVTHAAHRCFLSARCLYIIVYDGRSELRNRIEYWLNHVRNYGHNSPTLILVNIRDGNPPRLLENDLRRAYPFIQGFAYVNIDEIGNEMEDFRAKIKELVRNNLSWNNQVIPAADFYLKEKIEALFLRDKGKALDSIPRMKFDELAAECKIVPERVEEILGSLNELGSSLWYPDLAQYKLVVLNPDWITNGIYKAINWGRRNDKNRLSKSDFTQIYQEEPERYPEEKAEFIFKLMHKYELAYFEKEDIIIPSLLGDMPDKYLGFEQEFENDSLLMEYRAESYLPENIISRLTVRLCEYVQSEGDIWLKGAVLHDNKADAFIIEESENRISIRVRGAAKTAFLTKIRETINSILETYRSQRPEPWYRIIDDASTSKSVLPKETLASMDDTVMKSQSDIISAANAELPIPISESGRTVSTMSTVNNYNIIIVKNSDIHGSVFNDTSTSKTTIHVEINMRDCVINFQGEIKSLEKDLRKKGFCEDADYLSDINDVFDEVQEIIDNHPSDKEEINNELTKKGLLSKFKDLYDEFTDNDSELYKQTIKLRNGAKRVQSILNAYDNVAKWIPGAPRVPEPLLKLGKN
ncbi:MAG: hypothetical protein FWC09_11080, partial [Lachnospiraceae bacterium]|nr:hypothetical protein [Lachnospiraceae bacterium]